MIVASDDGIQQNSRREGGDMDIAGKRLLVVGGAGLIGSHVVDELLKTDVARSRRLRQLLPRHHGKPPRPPWKTRG